MRGLKREGGSFVLDGFAASLGCFPQLLRYPEPALVPTHQHAFYEVCLCLEGEGTHVQGSRRRPMRPGDAFFFPQGSSHSYHAGRGLVVFNLMFQPSVWDFLAGEGDDETLGISRRFRMFQAVPGQTGAVFPPAARQRILAACFQALHAYLQAEIADGILLAFQGALNTIALELEAQAGSAVQPKPELVNRMLEYLNRHAHEDCSLSEVASVMGRERSYLSALFRRHTGLTLSSYTVKLRLERAKHLLLATNQPIIEIALEAGFSDVSYFNHRFKRQERISPRAYRQRFRLVS